MTDSTTSGQASKPYDIKPKIFRRFAQVGVFVLALSATLFLSSGRLDWMMAWVYIGIYIVGIAVTASILITTDPELVAERAEMGKGTRSSPLRAPCLPGTLLVSGLDMRFGWTAQLPSWRRFSRWRSARWQRR